MRQNPRTNHSLNVINNRTVNWYSMRNVECVVCQCAPDLSEIDDVYETTAQFDWNDSGGNGTGDKLHIPNMDLVKKYKVEFYDGMTGAHVMNKVLWTDILGKLKIEYPELGDTYYAQSGELNGSMLLIKVYREKEGNFKMATDTIPQERAEDIREPIVTDLVLELNVGEEVKKSDNLVLYPNPAYDFLNVELSRSFTNEVQTIDVYSIKGEHQMSINPERKMRVDVSKMPSGTYVLIAHGLTKDIQAKFIKR